MKQHFDRRIDILKSCQTEGWDGRGAIPVSQTAIDNVIKCKDVIDTNEWLIAPDVCGGVDISNKMLSAGVVFHSDNTITWFCEDEYCIYGEEKIEFTIEKAKALFNGLIKSFITHEDINELKEL